jgi:hypothetical protein
MVQKRNFYKISVVKPEEKRLLGGPRGRWDDNIKMEIRETGCKNVGSIHLVQDKDFCEYANAHTNSTEGGEFRD